MLRDFVLSPARIFIYTPPASLLGWLVKNRVGARHASAAPARISA